MWTLKQVNFFSIYHSSVDINLQLLNVLKPMSLVPCLNLFFFRKFIVLCFTIILCLAIIKDIPINAFLIRTRVHIRIEFPISPNSLYCKC